MKYNFLVLLVSMLTCTTYAQLESNQDEFDEFMYRQGNSFRAASGVPGKDYFQNESDYRIDVELDPETHQITASMTMTYINNSPYDLDYIWMYVEQNRFTEDSRGTLTTPVDGNRYNGDTDKGMTIKNLVAETENSSSSKHKVTDTRMKVYFDKPIKANGGEAKVKMDFDYTVPVDGMDRMGRLETENGWIYAMAQWFPQVAVFDDVVGWNTEPYLGAGEFYFGYGDFEVNVTAPADQIVVSSGELLNPKEVLSKKVQRRLKRAQKSNKTVYLIKPDEVLDQSLKAKQSGTLTWKFKIDNARDFAFSASRAFIWDAAKLNLSQDKKALAQSAYPKESDGEDAWTRSTEYTKASIEYYSDNWYEYPYDVAVNVAADIGGMEYPALSFCSFDRKGEDLWGVTDHEFGHNWFPMIVGSNERHFAWMDEGFNTFLNYYSTKEFNNGEYPAGLDDRRRLVQWFKSDSREGIDTYPDATNLKNLGMTAYYKPALGLLMLREYILGEERFDEAFKSYINTWAYKHPQPSDFFNHIENVTGENLNWFWKNWFYGNDNIDLAVTDVKQKEGSYLLTFENKGDIPMPVHYDVTLADGSKETKTLPVEIWMRGNTWTTEFKTDQEVIEVEVDPDNILVDINSSNDTWSKSKKN